MPHPPRRGRGHRAVVFPEKAAAGVGVPVCCDARALLFVRERDRKEPRGHPISGPARRRGGSTPSTRHEGVLAHWFVATQVWSGFERCVFLFPYETTKRQGIPHDLDIMYELWRVERYQRRNRYLATSGVSTLIAALPPSSERADLEARVSKLAAAYDALADSYKKGPRPDVAFA